MCLCCFKMNREREDRPLTSICVWNDHNTLGRWIPIINAKWSKITPIVFLNERKYWEEEELLDFTFDLNSVDCVYYLDVACYFLDEVFCMLLRTRYKHRLLYVEVILIDRQSVRSPQTERK